MNLIKNLALGESLDKWLQSLAVFLHMNILITWYTLGWPILLLLAIFVPISRYPLLLYLAWVFYDRKSAIFCERRSHRTRNWKFWKYYNNYFPAKLHKTAELSPDRNYLICNFPHGVLCTGALCAFGNDYSKFSQMYPGLTSNIITLEQHFNFPFIREYCFALGAIPASAECLTYYLTQKKGVALVLMVGGAQEAFYSRPGVYKVNLTKRKGFIKIAYKSGASLVPSVSFGEPDLYNQVQFSENSLLRKLQTFLKKLTGIAPILFHGPFAFMPYKKPLNLVVGKPIEVEKINEPTREQIDALHAKFTEALTKLFESEKHKYIENAEKTHLIIV